MIGRLPRTLRRWLWLGTAVGLAGCAPLKPLADASPGPAWVAAWGSAQLVPNPPAAGEPPPPAVWQAPWADVSVRQVLRVTASGQAVRVQLSNAFGRQPLHIGTASLAPARTRPADTGAPAAATVELLAEPRALSFDGRREIELPPGAEVWSDALPLTVQRLDELAIQLYIRRGDPATAHPGSRMPSWAVAGDHADRRVWPGGVPRTGWWHLAAVDVQTGAPPPVLVATGDSITDGYGVPPASYARWTDGLARRLTELGHPATVVNTGIGGGRLLREGLGPSLLARFDRDVLDRSGATHAVVLIGVNDLGVSHRGRPTTAASRAELLAELKAGFTALSERAGRRGLCLIVATVLPYGGSDYYRPGPENEADRVALNAWLRGSGLFDAVVDFDALMRDPARPDRMRAELDIGDGLHPSPAGYRAMAEAFPPALLDRRCPARPANR